MEDVADVVIEVAMKALEALLSIIPASVGHIWIGDGSIQKVN